MRKFNTWNEDWPKLVYKLFHSELSEEEPVELDKYFYWKVVKTLLDKVLYCQLDEFESKLREHIWMGEYSYLNLAQKK